MRISSSSLSLKFFVVALSLIMTSVGRFRGVHAWSSAFSYPTRRDILSFRDSTRSPHRSLSTITRITKNHVRAIMEGFPHVGRSSHNLSDPFLTVEELHKMKTSDVKMELSFRGLKTKGDRVILINRLAKVLEDPEKGDGSSSSPSAIPGKTKLNLPEISPQHCYVLRTKGHTTQSSGGLGVGLALYDPDTDHELWSGRLYMEGDRTPFEAEYSAVILGMEYAHNTLGIRRLIVQTSCDIIVQQVRGVYKVNKATLRRLLEKEKELETLFADLLVEEIPSSQNQVCIDLATQALATRKSMNVDLDKAGNSNLSDPVKDFERRPTKDGRWRQPDPPSFSAPIDPSMTYLLRFDGGSRGNPGLAGAGFVLYDEQGQEIWCGWKYHHEAATNNLAEYLGLFCGVKCARSFGVERLVVEGDSQLIVRQLNGQYKCREESLKKFYNAVTQEAKLLEYFEIRHIPRDQNKRADWLANHAMDLQESGGFDELQVDI